MFMETATKKPIILNTKRVNEKPEPPFGKAGLMYGCVWARRPRSCELFRSACGFGGFLVAEPGAA